MTRRCKQHGRLYCVDENCRRREREAGGTNTDDSMTSYDEGAGFTTNGFPEPPAETPSASPSDTGSYGG